MDNNVEKLGLDQIITLATQIGIKIGLETFEKEKQKHKATRFDRRLHNIKLLMKNYRPLKTHVKDCVYSTDTAKESAFCLLADLDSLELADEMYIESIQKSAERTAVILLHVDNMLNSYRYECERSKNTEALRQYKVIHLMYVDEDEPTCDTIADTLAIDRSTVYRDRDKALERLVPLFFGIEGMRIK